ncbi:MAG: glycosyltransferase family 2 protein [Acidobacteria bacterium]|nr:glycosyltransferase family 2 protein [Acidobacteriota bacterium]
MQDKTSEKKLNLSVVIPTYGRPDRVINLVKQLLDQNIDPSSYEVIVVDDGSPLPVAPAIEAQCFQTAVFVRCLRQENSGPAVARNLGANSSSGEFILFVDDDMVVPRDFLRGHLETQHEFGPGAVVSHFDWKLDLVPTAFNNWFKKQVASWGGGGLPINLKPLLDEKVYEVIDGVVTAASLSVHRDTFVQLNGFDLGYSAASCEDQDFGRRLYMAGVRVFLTRKTSAIHEESRSSLEQLCQRYRRGCADTVRLVRRFAHLYQDVPPIAIINGYVRFKEDSWSRIAKKLIKRFIIFPWILPIVFKLVHWLETLIPDSKLLPKVYDLIIGAHLQQGWRDGLKKYGAVVPLMGNEFLGEWASLLEA